MPSDLLPGSILSLSAQAADRLLQMDSGDAALLYLYLLGHPDTTGLKWPALRTQTALDQLVKQGLAKLPTAPVAPDPGPEPPPEYSMEEINDAMTGTDFNSLCDEVERRLGKKFSTTELKKLFTIYDHLALPPEVILMLVTWCGEEMERKYGPHRPPNMTMITKEANIWANRGIDTIEAAEAHIQRMDEMRTREKEVLRLLDITPRPLVAKEKTYIAAWDEWGFDNESIRMAYEKTVFKKQKMDWGYMNGILRRWHEKGLHTGDAVRAGDRDPVVLRAGAGAGYQPQPQSQPGEDQRAREDMDRMRRMLRQMKEEG